MCYQSDTLLLAHVFNNFWNMCFEIYGLDPAHFLSAADLAWQVALTRTKVKLELSTDIDMLLMTKLKSKVKYRYVINDRIKINGGMSCYSSICDRQ